MRTRWADRGMHESSDSYPHDAPLRIADHPEQGVNVVGFLEVESGVGEIARRLVAALEVDRHSDDRDSVSRNARSHAPSARAFFSATRPRTTSTSFASARTIS